MAIGTPTSLGSVFASNSNTTAVITGVTASAGDLLLVFAGSDGDNSSGPGATSVADSASNTYTADTAAVIGGATGTGTDKSVCRLFSSVLSSGLSSGSITVTFSGISGTWDKFAQVTKVTGNWDSGRKDKSSTGHNNGTAWDSGAVATTAVAAELVYGGSAIRVNSATSTEGSPNIELFDSGALGGVITYTTVYQILSSTGTPKANGTWSIAGDDWSALVVTYKEASGGGGGLTADQTRARRTLQALNTSSVW